VARGRRQGSSAQGCQLYSLKLGVQGDRLQAPLASRSHAISAHLPLHLHAIAMGVAYHRPPLLIRGDRRRCCWRTSRVRRRTRPPSARRTAAARPSSPPTRAQRGSPSPRRGNSLAAAGAGAGVGAAAAAAALRCAVLLLLALVLVLCCCAPAGNSSAITARSTIVPPMHECSPC
jgi:hypothetical protein